MRKDGRLRARRRLDERLLPLKPAEQFDPPVRGWLRAVREALGMTGVQFAQRLGISPQSADAMEKSEASNSIQLKTLRRAAEALDCRLVYALIPNRSLEGAVNERARRIARRDLERVAHTMTLEAQATDNADFEARIESYVRDWLNERDLWREP